MQGELDTTEHSLQVKEQISNLEEESKTGQKEITQLADQFEQQQKELEIQGKAGVSVFDSDDY